VHIIYLKNIKQMKKLVIIILSIQTAYYGTAQKVGIGTNTPAFKLDVKDGSINTDSFYRIGGVPVLYVNGFANTFTGFFSGINRTTGQYNTANGFQALLSITSGYQNTAMGYFSLGSNTTGGLNTANGSSALRLNTSGNNNTATGHSSLNSNTIGNNNTATGHSSLNSNTTGSNNTSSGYFSLLSNTTGNNNTSNGSSALRSNISGGENTAVGYNALYQSFSSFGNTAIGAYAGDSHNNGYYNTFLGSYADANGQDYYSSIAIGNSSTVTAPIQVRIGSSFIESIGGYQNWTNISDGRYKKNIKEDVKGIDFIMKLRPVTYNLDVTGISQKLNESRGGETDKLMTKSISDKSKTIFSGFVAQEVEAVAKATGYDFSGVDKPKNANDFYGLRYAEFVVPLVKAMQEQQALIRDMQKQIDQLILSQKK
jgi:trimeric autotransporter adhesin